MDKTNLNTNWQRIASVIRWSNMTINHFAKHIGLSRAENLYQIKNGNNGISQKLAHRIVEAFPAISIGWLLSGEGVMLCEDNDTCLIPCFCNIESFLSYCQDEQTAPDNIVNFSSAADAEVAVVVSNAARLDDFCSTDDNVASKNCFFLKKIAIDAIIPSNYYMILTANFVYLRKVTAVSKSDAGCELLFDADAKLSCTMNLGIGESLTEESPNNVVALSDVIAAYKVVGVYFPMQ